MNVGLIWQSQRSSGLGTETREFLIVGTIVLIPVDRFVEPLACLILVTFFLVDQGQEKPIEAIPRVSQLERFFERLLRVIQLAGAIESHAERVPKVALLGLDFDRTPS